MRKAGYAYPYRSYGVSKMAVNAYVSVLHNNTRLAAAGGKSKLINVFSCCPGHVDTDLSGHLGPRTVDQGADTPVWLALQSPKGGSGKFWADRTEIEFQVVSRSFSLQPSVDVDCSSCSLGRLRTRILDLPTYRIWSKVEDQVLQWFEWADYARLSNANYLLSGMGSAWPIPCYIIVQRVGVKRVVVKVSSWRMNGLIFDNIVNAH